MTDHGERLSAAGLAIPMVAKRKVRADKIARARDVRENSTVEAIHCFLHKRCDLHLVQLWRGGGILQQLI